MLVLNPRQISSLKLVSATFIDFLEIIVGVYFVLTTFDKAINLFYIRC